MKTIRRNAHRKIAAIALTIVKVRMYSQDTGGMVDLTEGTTAASAVASALHYLNDPYSGAKLHDNEDGSYTIHVHSNLFFYLYTQAHLDQAAAEKAAREQRAAAHPRPASVPTREQRQARIEARTVLIHDLGKPAATPTPTVSVTRTRMAISDQISQACTALGIKLGHGWNKGTATFLVQGRDYTARELADLVLEGGFAGNYNGNTVNVRWDSPLRSMAAISEDRLGEAVVTLKEVRDRVPADAVAKIDRCHELIMNELHIRAIEGAPEPKVDYPPGAAEPGREVSAVRCVRTNVIFVRDRVQWRSTADGSACNWYRLNETDPMSEGFNVHHWES